MQTVKDIRFELAGSENKLVESLGHSREIGRLLGLVETGIGSKDDELKVTGDKLSTTSASLERAQKDLIIAIGESRQRKEDLEVLQNQLRSEKAEVSALQARLNNATLTLQQVEREIIEARSTSALRKEEIDSLSLLLIKEKEQVSSLRYEVESRTTQLKGLEARIEQLETRHHETVSQGEVVKADLERREIEKVIENESLKKTLGTLERKARHSDAGQLQKAKDVLETTYRTLQRQYQAKEDELDNIEREKEEYREKLACYDPKFGPSSYEKKWGLKERRRDLDVYWLSHR